MRRKALVLLLLLIAALALAACGKATRNPTAAVGTAAPPPESSTTASTTAPITPPSTTAGSTVTEPASSRPGAGEAPTDGYPALLTRVCSVCKEETDIAFNPDSDCLESILARLKSVCSCEVRSYTDRDACRLFYPDTRFSGNATVYASPVRYAGYVFRLTDEKGEIFHVAVSGDVITGDTVARLIPDGKVFVGFSADRSGSAPASSITAAEGANDRIYYVICADAPAAPSTVSLTLTGDLPFTVFYRGEALSSSFVTELTVSLPPNACTSELEFVLPSTKRPSRSYYTVSALLLGGEAGSPVTAPTALADSAALHIRTAELFAFEICFVNGSLETVYSEIGGDILAVLAETHGGNLNELLSSNSGGGYINLPTFYTDESRNEVYRVTAFSEDIIRIWSGIRKAPRLTLACVDGCVKPHGPITLAGGTVPSELLVGHGSSVPVSFYTDPDCQIPYVEEGKFPIYHTEDLTLYGLPSS